MKKKIIWISWEEHRRTKTLAKKLGAVTYILSSKHKRIIKHPINTIKTFHILISNRPGIVFVQNPSALLTLIAILLKYVLKYKMIVDAHNAGVYPCSIVLEKLKCFFKIFHKYADYTIVTNNQLAKIIIKNGGRAIVLPDALPEFENNKQRNNIGDKFIVTYICTFATDEPYEEVIKAAKFLPENIKLYITGNFRKVIKEKEYTLNENINFTGFIPDDEYIQLLSDSDCVIDLTKRPDCLVCGAYEAVALCLPLILSDTPVLRNYFKKGTIYTNNDAQSIARAIVSAMDQKKLLTKDMVLFKKQILKEWQNNFRSLIKIINIEKNIKYFNT